MPAPHRWSRRRFLKTAGTAALAAPFFTRTLRSAPPSGVLRHASFGSAGMAWSDIQAICSNEFVKLVAVAEVDLKRAAQVREAFPETRIYQDWRELLDKEHANLDSVNVSTPDHLHAPIALSALQLGKHVYCQKPLTHDLYEARALTNCARATKLVTQMGIQIHSMKVYRQAVALVQGGAIGKVKEVHTWSNKKWGALGAPPVPAEPVVVPDGFNWDLWLGGCEPRPFVGDGYYHPLNWRKRLDFGTGTFGDMGCHIFDPVFEALALSAPLTLRSEGAAPDAWNWSTDARIRYVFAGTRFTAEKTLPLTWYDGDQRPPPDIMALVPTPKPEPEVAPDGTPKRVKDPLSEGSILIGTKGVLHVPHVAKPRLFPVDDFKDYPFPEIEGTHHWSDWAEACVGGRAKPLAPFDYSGPLTETVLLGSVAVRFPHETMQWDSARLRFKNLKAANAFVRRTYRRGWGVAGL